MGLMGSDRLQATGDALLEWINRLPIPRTVTSLSSLNDGLILWEILRDLDPVHFAGDLPSDHLDSWLKRWQNLKQISKRLILYVTEERNQEIPEGRDWGDLKLIAENGATAEIIKLLSLILLATVYSPIPGKYIEVVMSLSTPEQQLIKDILDDAGAAPPASPHKESSTSDGVVSPLVLAEDPELQTEERLAKALGQYNSLAQEKDQLQRDFHALYDRVARLQQHNEALQGMLKQAEDNNKKGNSKRTSREDSLIKELESRLQQHEDLIESQESQLANYAARSDDMHKGADQLRKAAEAYQALQDMFDALKADRDGLARKANMIDKYKQRLQDSQDKDRENELIRDEIEELRHQLKDYEEAVQQISKLQVTVNEYKRILPKIEQDRVELQVMKKQLEFDNAALAQRCEAAKEQHVKDQEIIVDLSEKTKGIDSPRTPGVSGLVDLDKELGFGEETAAKQFTQDLKDKNQELTKIVATAEEEILTLQQNLNHVNIDNTDLKRRFFDTYQDKLTLEFSLEQMNAGRPIETTELYRKIRSELDNYRQSAKDLDTRNTSLKEQLRRVQADLSIVGKDKVEGLEELKRFTSIELISEQDKNTGLLQRIDKLEAEIREKNDMLLRELLAAKARASGEPSASKDFEVALEQIKAALRRTPHNEPATEEYLNGLTQRIAETRERLAEKQQHIIKQDLEMEELRERLEVAKSTAVTTMQKPQDLVGKTSVPSENDTTDTLKAAIQKELENVKRENRLIATAFHDLSSRIQRSNVTLQRRTETKGFLNRQRYAVNLAAAVRPR
ncbi:hypothetical protein MMC13_006027 [Lambiella insularis]|nr:hypothetical protein [Lambiella insularis]